MNSWFNRTESVPERTATLRVGEWTLETTATFTKWTASSSPAALPVLTQEVSLASKLRHPNVLQVIEPLKSTRGTLSFTTEPIQTTLQHLIVQSKQDPDLLDEVEIQKGLSQLLNALDFCHSSAKLVHRNLVPTSVLITAKGDWKLSGFGLATYLFDPVEGTPARWMYPEFRRDIPASCQFDFDYLAPEVLLDEAAPSVSQDLYSLGCLLHTIHLSHPPFSHRHSLENVRNNLDTNRSLDLLSASWRKLPQSTQAALASLLTRHASSRLTSSAFLASSYFSSVLVSSLRYLERSSFSVQSLEAQISFLKGLLGVLPRFSEKVRRKKILPSLLEEGRKSGLIPFILPNVMAIAKDMDFETFRTEALTPLKTFFTLKDPPAAIIALLDVVPLFILKTSPLVFREEVMPLIYGSLDSENPVILEKALRVVPGLAESLDYTTVKSILFPRITGVFSKTTSLSVKVNTLICFHSMIQILDKSTLTEKLVPLLAKIKTKEPAVTIATLAVHEEMGKKCEIEAVATLILPQLWTMSINPLLNQSQFKKFLAVITRLSTRVEMEHTAVLEEIGRLEESTRVAVGSGTVGTSGRGEMDFESLVRNGAGIGVGTDGGGAGAGRDFWADDESFDGSGTNSPALRSISPAPQPSSFPTQSARNQYNPSSFASQSTRNPPTTSSKAASILGARPGAKFDSNLFAPPPPAPTTNYSNANYSNPVHPTPAPTTSLASSFAPMQPSTKGKSNTNGAGSLKPNYNFTNPPSPNRVHSPPIIPTTNTPPIKWNVVPQLQPTQPILRPTIKPSNSSSWNSNAKGNTNGGIGKPGGGKSTFDWGDLDPLA